MAVKNGKTKNTGKTKGSKPRGSIYERLAGSISKGSGKNRFWNLPEGTSQLRFLTFEHKGQEEVAVQVAKHWNVECEDQEAKHMKCGGDECPICDLEEEVSKELWDKIFPKTTFMVNAVVRKDPTNDGKDRMVLVELPKSVWAGSKQGQGILDYITGDNPDIEDAFDLKKGRDFKITKSGKGKQTRYKVVPVVTPTAVGGNYEPVNLLATRVAADMDALEKVAEALKASD